MPCRYPAALRECEYHHYRPALENPLGSAATAALWVASVSAIVGGVYLLATAARDKANEPAPLPNFTPAPGNPIQV